MVSEEVLKIIPKSLFDDIIIENAECYDSSRIEKPLDNRLDIGDN